ncbi:MAG: ParB/RepB/Spo0J family partition protein, partial [Nitrososphaerales archaeon]
MKTHYGGSEIGVFERLPLSELRHSKRMVRESTGNIDELVESIRAHGLLEPIVVRPLEESFEVVAGNRRLEACRRLHKKSVACHVVTMDDATAYEESLIENIQRRNLNPIEEGEAFRKYVDDMGVGGVSRLARTIGKSESYVSRRIALLDLPQSIKTKMEEGRLSLMIAQELIPLPKADAASLARLTLD